VEGRVHRVTVPNHGADDWHELEVDERDAVVLGVVGGATAYRFWVSCDGSPLMEVKSFTAQDALRFAKRELMRQQRTAGEAG